MIVACISASRVPSSTANSIQMMKTCQAISQLGHEVHLFVPETDRPQGNPDLCGFYGLKNRFWIEWIDSRPAFHRYDFAYQAVRKAQNIKADLSYVWPIQAGLFSQLAGIPVLLELHGPPEGRFGPTLFRLFMKNRAKKRILPITHALANQLSEKYGLDMHNRQLVQISPNGVDLERYSHLPEPPAARLQLGLPSSITVGYTGHLYPGRGMTLLTELARRFPHISFLWVGGSETDTHTWRARLTGMQISNVILTGFIENSLLPLYQSAADILLMPYERVIRGSSGGDSSAYASPMKMFEYMACRRAIISSNLPVICEVLNPSNAILCPPEQPDAWSEALSTLLDNQEKQRSLAQQAWQDVQGYTWLERARKAFDGFLQPDRTRS